MSTPDYGANLRRLMAREGMTLDDVARVSGLDDRTIKGILTGRKRPQARTLHRLARGIGVSADELFQDPSLLAYRTFDRRSNPVVEEVVEANPQLFEGWTQGDFDELYSRFGAGGHLNAEGTLEAVRTMNAKRQVLDKVSLILESSESSLISEIVDVLYQRVVLVSPEDVACAGHGSPFAEEQAK